MAKKGALKANFKKAAMSTGTSIQKGIAKAKVGAKKLGQTIKSDARKVGNVIKQKGQKTARVAKLAGKAIGGTKTAKRAKSVLSAIKNA